jgi:hypothetical protein
MLFVFLEGLIFCSVSIRSFYIKIKKPTIVRGLFTCDRDGGSPTTEMRALKYKAQPFLAGLYILMWQRPTLPSTFVKNYGGQVSSERLNVRVRDGTAFAFI